MCLTVVQVCSELKYIVIANDSLEYNKGYIQVRVLLRRKRSFPDIEKKHQINQ